MRSALRATACRSMMIVAVLLGAATTARAQARIEDCEKIQAADAYNQCLGKFGPTSKVKNVTPAQPGDVKGSGAEAAGVSSGEPTGLRVGRHGHRGRFASSHRGGRHYGSRGKSRHAAKASGRKRMTITIHRQR